MVEEEVMLFGVSMVIIMVLLDCLIVFGVFFWMIEVVIGVW